MIQLPRRETTPASSAKFFLICPCYCLHTKWKPVFTVNLNMNGDGWKLNDSWTKYQRKFAHITVHLHPRYRRFMSSPFSRSEHRLLPVRSRSALFTDIITISRIGQCQREHLWESVSVCFWGILVSYKFW